MKLDELSCGCKVIMQLGEEELAKEGSRLIPRSLVTWGRTAFEKAAEGTLQELIIGTVYQSSFLLSRNTETSMEARLSAARILKAAVVGLTEQQFIGDFLSPSGGATAPVK